MVMNKLALKAKNPEYKSLRSYKIQNFDHFPNPFIIRRAHTNI